MIQQDNSRQQLIASPRPLKALFSVVLCLDAAIGLGWQMFFVPSYAIPNHVLTPEVQSLIKSCIAKAQSGDSVGAERDWEKVQEIDPSYMGLKNFRSARKIFIHGGLDYSSETNLYLDCILFDDGPGVAPDGYSYLRRGEDLYKLGDFEGAIASINQAIASDSRNPDHYYHRGNAKYSMGDNEGAIADYSKAITIYPYHADSYFSIAFIKGMLGDEKAGLGYHNKGLEVQADNIPSGKYVDSVGTEDDWIFIENGRIAYSSFCGRGCEDPSKMSILAYNKKIGAIEVRIRGDYTGTFCRESESPYWDKRGGPYVCNLKNGWVKH